MFDFNCSQVISRSINRIKFTSVSWQLTCFQLSLISAPGNTIIQLFFPLHKNTFHCDHWYFEISFSQFSSLQCWRSTDQWLVLSEKVLTEVSRALRWFFFLRILNSVSRLDHLRRSNSYRLMTNIFCLETITNLQPFL